MAKYLVNVTQENMGCYAASFDSLDAVREFAHARAASFKKFSAKPVTVLVVKNGGSIEDGRTFVL